MRGRNLLEVIVSISQLQLERSAKRYTYRQLSIVYQTIVETVFLPARKCPKPNWLSISQFMYLAIFHFI